MVGIQEWSRQELGEDEEDVMVVVFIIIIPFILLSFPLMTGSRQGKRVYGGP